MFRRHNFLKSVLNFADMESELQPRVPVVELAGNRRVLIENHHAVIDYASDEIRVKVDSGEISVQGCDLQLAKLAKEQLVITGRVRCVALNWEVAL